MNDVLGQIGQIVSQFDAAAFLKVILPLGLICFGLGLVFRLLLGKESSVNRAITSCTAILVIYILVLIGQTYLPQLAPLVHSLPLISLEDTVVKVQSLQGLDLAGICQVLFPLVLLSFTVNLLETLLPKSKNVILWLLTRLLLVVLSLAGYTALQYALHTLVPSQWLQWLPTALLAILALSFLLAAVKLLLGLALAAVNPVIAALYGFFFGQKVGKSMSRSLLTALVLVVCSMVLEHLGYTQLDLALISADVFAPGGAALLVIWYIVCRIF